jgi:hypothetical protein
VNAEEENEELRQAINEPFSLAYEDLCKENMELKFRIMDLKEALEEITGSTEAAAAAEYLGGKHAIKTPRKIQRVVWRRVQELYEDMCGAGSFSRISQRLDDRQRARVLEDEGAEPGPFFRGRDEAAQPAP